MRPSPIWAQAFPYEYQILYRLYEKILKQVNGLADETEIKLDESDPNFQGSINGWLFAISTANLQSKEQAELHDIMKTLSMLSIEGISNFFSMNNQLLYKLAQDFGYGRKLIISILCRADAAQVLQAIYQIFLLSAQSTTINKIKLEIMLHQDINQEVFKLLCAADENHIIEFFVLACNYENTDIIQQLLPSIVDNPNMICCILSKKPDIARLFTIFDTAEQTKSQSPITNRDDYIYFCLYQLIKMVEKKLQHPALILLYWATLRGHIALAKLILRNSEYCFEGEFYNHNNDYFISLSHIACIKNHFLLARDLVEFEQSTINMPSVGCAYPFPDNTLLKAAVLNHDKHFLIFSLLLIYNANPNVEGLLQFAHSQRSIQCAAMITQQPNVTNQQEEKNLVAYQTTINQIAARHQQQQQNNRETQVLAQALHHMSITSRPTTPPTNQNSPGGWRPPAL